MRQYEPIWHRLKQTGHAAVRCAPTNQDTLINAVIKEKCRETVQRKAVGLPPLGRLSSVKGLRTVTFKLERWITTEDL